MQIRKNTKAFKAIVEIVTTCHDRPDREKFVRLYITKAGHSVQDRINVEGIQGGDPGFFYDMTYETVLGNLKSSTHQLMVSDDVPGIYFFHSTSNKIWDETPFEFDEAIIKEFSSLPELPVTRKKGKTEKFELSDTKEKSAAPLSKAKQTDKTKEDKNRKDQKSSDRKTGSKEPNGPDFKLKRDIHFTNLNKVIFRQSAINKLAVLEYYDKIAETILPYLKDRPLSTRREVEVQKPSIEMSAAALFPDEEEEIPDWIKRQTMSEGKQRTELLLCNDKEHLLYYIETGSLGFEHSLSRVKTHHNPDYVVIVIDSPEFDIASAVEVALGAKEIFDGLKLRSAIKTDGVAGLHVYMPLDAKSTYDTTIQVAEYLCKLIRIKLPDLVSLEGSDDNAYGKVSLDYSFNAPGKTVVAPYSLVPGTAPVVATPLLWEEVKPGLHPESFSLDTIFKRLKQVGDPMESQGKKINADELLARLVENYSFLV